MKLKIEAELAQKAGRPEPSQEKKRPSAKIIKVPEPTEEDKRRFELEDENIEYDNRDLSWSAVMKRTFEGYIRGERPNMYGEWLKW